jgi:hypothetical protein
MSVMSATRFDVEAAKVRLAQEYRFADAPRRAKLDVVHAALCRVDDAPNGCLVFRNKMQGNYAAVGVGGKMWPVARVIYEWVEGVEPTGNLYSECGAYGCVRPGAGHRVVRGRAANPERGGLSCRGPVRSLPSETGSEQMSAAIAQLVAAARQLVAMGFDPAALLIAARVCPSEGGSELRT